MSPRQRETIRFIQRYQSEHEGQSPTLQEIAAGLGLKGRSNAQAFVAALEKQGLLTRDSSVARGITLTGAPLDLSLISDGDLLVEVARRGLIKLTTQS
jgi:SOS-response transcriptional repressor LexA